MNHPSHFLLGRKIDVGKAASKWETGQVKKELREKKLFVTGIGLEVDQSKRFTLFNSH